MLYRLFKHVLLGPALRLVFRPDVEGLEHLPAEGPAILASNHLSFSDSIFLPLVCPRPITFLAKDEYFHGRGIKGLLIKAFMTGVGQVPIDRTGGRSSEAALRTGLRILGEGRLLGIYPEGTRSGDGRLYRGKTGVARMALEAERPGRAVRDGQHPSDPAARAGAAPGHAGQDPHRAGARHRSPTVVAPTTGSRCAR